MMLDVSISAKSSSSTSKEKCVVRGLRQCRDEVVVFRIYHPNQPPPVGLLVSFNCFSLTQGTYIACSHLLVRGLVLGLDGLDSLALALAGGNLFDRRIVAGGGGGGRGGGGGGSGGCGVGHCDVVQEN